MKSSAFYAVLGLGVIVIGGVIWWGTHAHRTAPVAVTSQTTTSPSVSSTTSLAGLAIYTNGKYGFSIFYPQSDSTETTFDSQYYLPATWRVNALNSATGTPIFAIIGYKTQSDTSYPRYFETEVRIGASADPQEIAACDTTGNGEVALPDTVINKVIWKTFSLQDDAMMQYLNGTSYRTIHDNTCFALEEIETGSSYRDDATSTSDIPDSVLSQKFKDLDSIVQSFSFARP